MNSIRVLIVDDSAVARRALAEALASDPAIEVVGTAHDAYAARDKIVTLKPDVMTLDVEMPRLDGVAFLRKLMPQFPLPVIMVSALTAKGRAIALEALEAGALDIVTKPGGDVAALGSMMQELRTKIKIAAAAKVSHWQRGPAPQLTSPPAASDRLLSQQAIVIGASTGGTEALRLLLAQLPPLMPGIAVVQHMPGGFTRMFAERLNELCSLQVKEAATGDRLAPGTVLIAPGGHHLALVRQGDGYAADIQTGEPVNGHAPSVDVLMQSAAQLVGNHAVGVLLTGMGRDGAMGLKAIRRAGGHTIGQDESTCVVYGMPREADRLGACEHMLPLPEIAAALVGFSKEHVS